MISGRLAGLVVVLLLLPWEFEKLVCSIMLWALFCQVCGHQKKNGKWGVEMEAVIK